MSLIIASAPVNPGETIGVGGKAPLGDCLPCNPGSIGNPGGVGGHWSGVRSVSDVAPGPLPFMHTVLLLEELPPLEELL